MSLARVLRILRWWQGRLLALSAGILLAMAVVSGLSAAQEAAPEVAGQPTLPAVSAADLWASPPFDAQASGQTDSQWELRSRLTPFGYRLFQQLALTPPPVTGPVHPSYRIGPDDEFVIQISGAVSERHSVVVDQEGRIFLPKAGVLEISGLTFDEARALIQRKLFEFYVGVDITVSLGRLRTIQVWVLGEVLHPGQYTIGGLANVMHALAAAGGIVESGSLRNVRVVRAGQVIAVVDLYEFLITGTLGANVRLQDGDVISVPVVGPQAGVAGEVRRPGLYELAQGETLADLIEYAGGFTAQADVRFIRLERISEDGQRTLRDIALPDRDALTRGEVTIALQDGDLVFIPSVDSARLPAWGDEVRLEGHVLRPGRYQWVEGMTVRQLLERAGGVLDETLMARGEVLRFVSQDTRRVLPFDVSLALQGDPEHDLELSRWDIITIYSVRDVIPQPVVRSAGQLHEPGEYPLTPGMRVRDLIFRSRELTDAAYLSRAELFRAHRTEAYELREVIVLNLERLLQGDESQNVLLEPDDLLMVYGADDLMHVPQVRIAGLVRNPGTYELTKGMRLSDLLARAGGLQAGADPAVARVEIFRRSPHGATVFEADLPAVHAAALGAAAADDADPLLQEGDTVYVRTRFDYASLRTVQVSGAVRYPGTYALRPGERLGDVLERAGGLADDAYLYGAVLTRPSLAEQQQRFIQDLVQSELLYIERERARLEEMPLTADERERRWRALEHRANIVEIMQSRAPQGRVILDVRAGDNELPPDVADFLLLHGDQLHVPYYPGTVLVAGAVYMPEALLYVPGRTIDDYLRQVGGPLRDADLDGIYVIKANGRVETRWTGFSELHAGDAIVVPYRAEFETAAVAAGREEGAP